MKAILFVLERFIFSLYGISVGEIAFVERSRCILRLATVMNAFIEKMQQSVPAAEETNGLVMAVYY